MKILLTNDDGFDSEGLNALRQLMSSYGQLTICAPKLPHSYAGHRVTPDRPLELTKYHQQEDFFHLSGTPADCSRIALTQICPDVDWVISGINHGANLGVDVYTSGTVAAAREASILGYQSIAISHYILKGKIIDWNLATSRLKVALDEIFQKHKANSGYWNINLPHPNNLELCEFKICELDPSPLQVKYLKSNNSFHYNGEFALRPKTPEKDVDECLVQEKITGTLLTIV